MVGHACLVLMETLAALALLALFGGWLLLPFRSSARPYLGLATPLAGIAVLALVLTILYHSVGLSLPLALVVAVPLNAAPTLFCLVRRWRRGGTMEGWKLPLAVWLGVSVWCTWCCNRTAILAGEPTACMQDGSDTFGYAQVASWLLHHPQESASWQPGKPQEAYVHVMEADPRPGAYLLTAAASLIRGTTPLFSFDWLTGVGLAAGILALIGGFASGRSSLFFLLAAGILSSWFTLSRSGYLGKILAYPGCLLLASVLLATWRQFSMRKLLAGAVLGLGIGLCHSPATPLTLLGLLLGGLVVALLLHWLRGDSVPDLLYTGRPDWTSLARGLLGFLGLVGPILISFAWWVSSMASAPPKLELAETRLLSFALDVDNPHVPFAGPRLAPWLIGVALALNALGWIRAHRTRNVEAASFLLCVGVVAVAWWGHHWELSHFAGTLFPLGVIGVALLWERQQTECVAFQRKAATVMLALAMLGSRVFQFEQSYQRYKVPVDSPYCFRQSSVNALVRCIGDKTVDVEVSNLYTSLMLITELGGRDIRLQLHPSVWSRLLAYTHWPAPNYSRKGDFTLCDGGLRSAAECVRVRTAQFQLVGDEPVLTLAAP